MYAILLINPSKTGCMRFSDCYSSTSELAILNFTYLIIHLFNIHQRKKSLSFNLVSCGSLSACRPWPMRCQRLSAVLNMRAELPA